MTRRLLALFPFTLAIVLFGAPAIAQTPQTPSHCIAVPLPSLRGAEGDTSALATSVREIVSTFLTSPSVKIVPLEARLAQPALDEARQKSCETVLTLTLTRKRSGGGGMGRVVGSAAGAAAWHVPYTGAASAAARGAAAAASDLAANTQAKDEWSLEYRLAPTAGAKALASGNEKLKANSDGEDVVTPLVERMATAVYAAVVK